jgi:hypothetical protein
MIFLAVSFEMVSKLSRTREKEFWVLPERMFKCGWDAYFCVDGIFGVIKLKRMLFCYPTCQTRVKIKYKAQLDILLKSLFAVSVN